MSRSRYRDRSKACALAILDTHHLYQPRLALARDRARCGGGILRAEADLRPRVMFRQRGLPIVVAALAALVPQSTRPSRQREDREPAEALARATPHAERQAIHAAPDSLCAVGPPAHR